ncbi:MAG TPA: hypothetical protein VFB54_08685 [Burkholderiales bacterium]|nr:hypothetical protein [Burkholderiales bacterium]
MKTQLKLIALAVSAAFLSPALAQQSSSTEQPLADQQPNTYQQATPQDQANRQSTADQQNSAQQDQSAQQGPATAQRQVSPSNPASSQSSQTNEAGQPSSQAQMPQSDGGAQAQQHGQAQSQQSGQMQSQQQPQQSGQGQSQQQAQQPGQAQSPQQAQQQGQAGTMPPHYEAMLRLQGTVQSIDPASKMVTLRMPDGSIVQLHAPNLPNFDQLKQGDEVNVTYREALVTSIAKAAQNVPPQVITEATREAAPGQEPAVRTVVRQRVIAEVSKIDRNAQRVTLTGPLGVVDLKVQDKNALNNLKEGDRVMATYTEAIVVAVEPSSSNPSAQRDNSAGSRPKSSDQSQ